MNFEYKTLELKLAKSKWRVKNRFLGCFVLLWLAIVCLISPSAVESAFNAVGKGSK